jgi:hypothetical protein
MLTLIASIFIINPKNKSIIYDKNLSVIFYFISKKICLENNLSVVTNKLMNYKGYNEYIIIEVKVVLERISRLKTLFVFAFQKYF